MANHLLAWCARDLRVSSWVFMGFTLLNVFLLCAGLGVRSDGWFWAFAFPVMAARHLGVGFPEWPGAVLVVVNPWLYGLMGWCAWRMWKLMRTKRAE